MRPMPCSAEIEPFMRVHDVVHDAVEALPFGEERRLVHADRLGQVEVDVAVAEMAEGADPQARHLPPRRPRVAASMNSATRETGTETSCLIEPPSRRCTSERLSRKRQSARFCASLARSSASSIRPSSRALAEDRLEDGPGGPRPLGATRARPARRRHGRPASGRTAPGACLQHDVEAEARHVLEGRELVARGVAQALEERRGHRAARRSRRRRSTRACGSGKSFSTAAVMMPSVPSEPMKRSFRS